MIKILIAHRYPLIRAGLSAAFADVSDLEIVGITAEPEEIDTCIRKHDPDIIIIDDTTTLLSEYSEQMKNRLFVLAMSYDEETFFYCIRSGAVAYETVSISAQDLLTKIRRVAAGEYLLSSDQLSSEQLPSAIGVEQYRKMIETPEDKAPECAPSPLSTRETDILQMVVNGTTSSKELARALNISDQTVKNHFTSIYNSLGVSDRVAALRAGYIQLRAYSPQ